MVYDRLQHTATLFALSGLIVAAAFILPGRIPSSFAPAPLAAQTPTPGLSGWAWSDTVGWISWSGTAADGSPYGVTLSGDGVSLVGYGWSENIGWIKFGGLSSFPTGGGTSSSNALLSGPQIVGWARACAGTANGDCSTMTSRTDGWDGWISLSGTGYGPTVSAGVISGWAWGGDVVGWISMSGTALDGSPYTTSLVSNPASCTLTAPSTEVATGANFNLAWTTTNAASGTIKNHAGTVIITNPTLPSGFSDSVTAPGTPGSYTYTMTVENSSGNTNTCGDTVEVVTAPPPAPEAEVASFTATPLRVRKGSSATLAWTIESPPEGGCSITGSNGFSGTATGASGSISSGAITESTTFTLSCSGGSSATAQVLLVPEYLDI